MEQSTSLDHVLVLAENKQRRLDHRPNSYPVLVVSCAQATRSPRGGLSCEIKHLLLETSLGLCMAHLPADKNTSLRWVKSVLGVAEAFFADPSKHFKANPLVRPGTISVLVEPFWSLLHLIDPEVFERELMTTNDGRLFGDVQFDPRILKYTPTHMVADFNAPITAHRSETLRIFKLPDQPPCDQQAGGMGC